jgi:hypothetical protein
MSRTCSPVHVSTISPEKDLDAKSFSTGKIADVAFNLDNVGAGDWQNPSEVRSIVLLVIERNAE